MCIHSYLYLPYIFPICSLYLPYMVYSLLETDDHELKP